MSLVHPQNFLHVVYFTAAGAGDNGGGSYGNAKSMAADNATVWAIPAGTIIKHMYVIIDTAITGTSNLDFGDDDDPDGFVDGSLSITLGTPGLYGADSDKVGAYLQEAGVVQWKYYSAAGKEVKMDLTTAGTAGAFRLVIEGAFVKAY